MLNLFLLLISFNICFSQLNVKEAIDKCLENNLYLKAYKLNTEIEKFDQQFASYRPNPIFNNQSIFLIQQKNLDLVKPNKSLFSSMYANQLWFQVTKPMQIGGKRKNKMNVQKEEFILSELDLKNYKNQLAYNVANQWLDVWYSDEILKNHQSAKNNIDSIYEAIEVRFKKKEASLTDVNRTLILSERHATQVNIAWQNFQTELQKFNYLIGNANDSIDFESNFIFYTFSKSDSNFNFLAKNNRIDLKINIQQSKILLANHKLQKSLAIPNMEVGVIANPQNTQPYLGWYFQMPIPILDRNKANIGKAKSQILQAELQKAALEIEINTQTNYTYQEYIINKANFEQYANIRTNSYNILKDIKNEYLNGKTTLVDYLYAKQSWNETEQEYDIADYKYRKAYLDLLLVSGVLYQ